MKKFRVQITYTYDLNESDYAPGTSLEDMARAQGPIIADLVHSAIKQSKPGLLMRMAVVRETPTTTLEGASEHVEA